MAFDKQRCWCSTGFLGCGLPHSNAAGEVRVGSLVSIAHKESPFTRYELSIMGYCEL